MPMPDHGQMFSSSNSSTEVLFLGAGTRLICGGDRTGFARASLGAVQPVGAGLCVIIHSRMFLQVPGSVFMVEQ